MHKLPTCCIALLFATSAFAQQPAKKQKLYIGAGVGLDHGGFGLKAEYQPFKYLGIFFGGGYDLVGPSGNLGVIYNILPNKNFTPIVTVMGGINGVILTKYIIANGGMLWESRGQYAGVTPGVGFDFKFGRRKNQKVNLSMLIPLRDASFYAARNSITSQGGTIERDASPVLVAAGWNIDLLNLKKR